jgi:phosphatidylglycerophosphate synthase
MSEEPLVRRDVKARQTGWARRAAAALAARGVRPNTISWLSVVFAAASAACLVFVPTAGAAGRIGLLVGAAVLIQCRLLCNLFDGMVAVEGGLRTKSGEIFNDLPDRLSDPAILIGVGYAIRSMPFGIDLGWLAALLAVLTAYVRVLGGATGAGQFFLGPMAKQHRLAVLTVALVAAAVGAAWRVDSWVLAGALGIIIAGCIVTVVRRAIVIVRALESR